MADSIPVTLTINGTEHSITGEPRLLLVHAIRDVIGLTGTHVGCDTSQCGACTVLLNGQAVKSCSMLAVQADGQQIETVEGLADPDSPLHPIQQAFADKHGLQCGFCTPGMLMLSKALLSENPEPDQRRNPPRPRRKHVPLHRLPEHRPGDRTCGGQTLYVK